ncbi:MAG TPA: ABC transporter permease, partial [Blastocatellia bacterium]|nr:ABC transporter permease [Blastocatellia bacterium]
PDELTVLAYRQKNGPLQPPFSIPEFQDIRDQSGDIFSGVLAFQDGQDGLTVSGHTEPVLLNFVSGNYFALLGIKPALGRFFLPSEGSTAGSGSLMVLSYSYWRTRFGGDSAVVGRQVSIDGRPVTVIGVAPSDFHGIESLLDVRAFLPLSMINVETWTPPDFMTNRELRNLTVVGRLKASVTLTRAAAGLRTVAGNIARQHPESDAGLSLFAFAERLSRPRPDPSNTVLKIAALFMILAAFVLGLACVNVGNLLLVRASVRGREMALRVALGAGRTRLIRQLLTESAMLAFAGAVAGVLTGLWASRAIASVNLNTGMPILLDQRSEWRLFVFGLAAGVVTGLLAGIVPAVRASRGNVNELLRDGGGRTSTGRRYRLRNSLVVLQIAGSLTLLIVAGLLTRSLQNAERSDLGFDPSHVLNLTMDPHEMGCDQTQGRQFYKQLLDRVRALPGVSSAATAATVPMGYAYDTDTVRVPGYQLPPGEPYPIVPDNFVSPGYFKTMGMKIITGRGFTDQDDFKSPNVVIVNQTMANLYWPGRNPIGWSFSFADGPPRTAEIVGIVKDSRFQGMAGAIGPAFYAPVDQVYPSLETLHVRTEGRPDEVAQEIAGIIREMAPTMPVFDVQPMTRALDTTQGLLVYRFGALLAASLGILGVLLAIIGVYGVVSYGVSRRTQEIGVRLALGATPSDVLALILGQGITIVGAGLALGVAAAIAVARLATGFLVGVGPVDPPTYIFACVTLAAVALAACYIPARRAMRMEATNALRYE